MQGNIHERGIRQSLDWSLVLYYVLLVLIGWVNIYASTQSAGPDSIFDFDPTKLSVHTRDIGLAGIEVYDILRDVAYPSLHLV